MERVKARLEVMADRRGLDGREAIRCARAIGGRMVEEELEVRIMVAGL